MKAGTNRDIQGTPQYKLQYVKAHIHIKKKQLEILAEEILKLEREQERLEKLME